ncbi:MAG: hypothetical protein O3A25_20475 [Acidobacteria bacterium]|nr:hypothetical protein [Acidobacteriota bacterium]
MYLEFPGEDGWREVAPVGVASRQGRLDSHARYLAGLLGCQPGQAAVLVACDLTPFVAPTEAVLTESSRLGPRVDIRVNYPWVSEETILRAWRHARAEMYEEPRVKAIAPGTRVRALVAFVSARRQATPPVPWSEIRAAWDLENRHWRFCQNSGLMVQKASDPATQHLPSDSKWSRFPSCPWAKSASSPEF